MLSTARPAWLLGLSIVLVVTSVSLSQSTKPQKRNTPASAPGKQLFASNCAACHGLDGKGSERAPNIADGANVRKMSHSQLVGIIQNGIPGTGMPAFYALSAKQMEALTHHLETLGGAGKPQQLPGDPTAGKTLFTGKAGCSGCHMVLGQGGFIAVNLSDYAKGHSADQIRNAVLKPGSAAHPARTATIMMRSGERYTGKVRNEDNFSIQLQGTDGAFHLLSRSDVTSFEYDSKPMMPSDYATTLSSKELDDLESYLINVAGPTEKSETHKSNAADCFPWCDSEN